MLTEPLTYSFCFILFQAVCFMYCCILYYTILPGNPATSENHLLYNENSGTGLVCPGAYRFNSTYMLLCDGKKNAAGKIC